MSVLIPARKEGALGVATVIVRAGSVEQGLAFLRQAKLEFMPDEYFVTYGEPNPRLPVLCVKEPSTC